MKHSPISGVGYLFRGFALITKPGIRPFAIIPLLINVVLFAIGLWYALAQFQLFLDWLGDLLPSWLQWLEWLVIPIFLLAMVATVFFTFSIVANIVGAPFNSILAERVEQHLRGKKPTDTDMGMKEIFARIIPLIWNEINKVAYSILWAIPFLLLFIVPVVQIAAPFLWLLFSAWILAIQYVDIPMGNHDMTGKEVRQQLREKRAMSLGFGGMTLLMTSIPLFNFLVMPTAVAGATAMWVEALEPRP
jgi:CysZ protein